LRAPHVPGGRVAGHVIAANGTDLWLLPVSAARQAPDGVHGSLDASLAWQAGAGRRLAGRLPTTCLQPMAALLHAGLIAGAMQRVFDITLGYGNERVQFGKSIGKFQAIQHQLAVMAEHVVAAGIATEAAFRVDDLAGS